MPDALPTSAPVARKNVAIACGGTGGHLFPGIAVGQELLRRGCAVTLMISPKDVDQQAVKSVTDMAIVKLPAVGLTGGNVLGFARGFWQSYRQAKTYFAQNPPQVVLAMGGFTSAPPVLAGKSFGAKTFLHESNTIPGRANRWMAPRVDGAFVYFPQTAGLLRAKAVEPVGMPVRPAFLNPMKAAEARVALGLNPDHPVLLIMGGSQGASKVNELIMAALPQLRKAVPELQFIHLTGPNDCQKIQQAYAAQNCPAMVRAFFDEMGLALAAATMAVSRAGASSLAESAACHLPTVLIPYPTAADNHQFHNARAFVQSGAARMVPQPGATPEYLANEILDLLRNPTRLASMQKALGQWHQPGAAEQIAAKVLNWEARPQQSAHSASLPEQKKSSPPGFNVAKQEALNA